MKVGDHVRLRPRSQLRDLLAPWAGIVGQVVATYQDDDDDGLRIAVAFPPPNEGYTSPLSAEDFEVATDRPGEPF